MRRGGGGQGSAEAGGQGVIARSWLHGRPCQRCRAWSTALCTLAWQEGGLEPSEAGGEAWAALLELWFTYSLLWGVGGSCDEDGRKRFDAFMRWGRVRGLRLHARADASVAGAGKAGVQPVRACVAGMCVCGWGAAAALHPASAHPQAPLRDPRLSLPAMTRAGLPRPPPPLRAAEQGSGQPHPRRRQRV